MRLDRISHEIQGKLDTRGKLSMLINLIVDFDEFDEILRKKIEELQNHLL